MAYRDELEAARERAAALERELADKERALAERERALAEKNEALAQKDRALADAKEDLEDAAAEQRKRERQAARVEEEPARAREALETLAAKGKQRQTAKPAAKTKIAPPPSAKKLARRRLLRSVTALSNFIASGDAVFMVPVSAVFFGVVGGIFMLKLPFWFAVPVGASVPLLLSYVLFPLYAMIKLSSARRWPGTLPYRLEGYPQILEIKPRERESKDPFHVPGLPAPFRDSFDPKGHTVLRLTLGFAKKPPPGLAEMLRGFDPDLRADDDDENSFSRESPVSEDFSKSGTRRDNLDDNRQVHRWIRRCHRKVLRHLATAHGLVSARISLK